VGIYRPRICDLVDTTEEVNRTFTMVTNPPASLLQLLTHIKKATTDIKLFAGARRDENAIEIDIF
jgi:hypothetical protein